MKKILIIVSVLFVFCYLGACAFPEFNGNNSNNNSSPSGKVEDLSNIKTDFEITYVLGTEDAYTVSGNTITFNPVTEDTTYAISGSLNGNIVINPGNTHKFYLDLEGFQISCDKTNPITILSGSEVQITAKNGFNNYIHDYRSAIDPNDVRLYPGCIYSEVDLEISGKGNLEVYSKNNNGIQTKDDLQVKNLNLYVVCQDNALKGNDSVSIESGTLNLISKIGDGIKTSNTHIGSSGTQKGNVTILAAKVNIYAACDGIDAAFDVIIDNEFAEVFIYTDLYSNYSTEHTTLSSDYYIALTNDKYNFSILYINDETGESEWVDADYYSTGTIGRTPCYFFKAEKLSNYSSMEVYVYNDAQEFSQNEEYVEVFEFNTNNNCDVVLLNIADRTYRWSNYSINTNTDLSNASYALRSAKGIKAGNSVIINDGNIEINSYDSGIYATKTTVLDDLSLSTGNITINGGTINIISKGFGIHTDSTFTINGGDVLTSDCYLGLMAAKVEENGGNIEK